MKKLISLTTAFLAISTLAARDFTYNGIPYTVIDESAHTCKTSGRADYSSGNNGIHESVESDLVIPEKVFDADTQYTVTAIGENSFNGYELTSVSLPASLTSIGSSAFANCSNLSEINIPESVLEIGDSAFSGTAITSIYIPASISTLNNGVDYGGSGPAWSGLFAGCYGLANITVSPQNPYYTSVDGVVYNKDLTEMILCPAGKTGELVIPETVTKTAYNAAIDSSISSVSFPESLTTIGSCSFYNCKNITELNLPKNLTIIETQAFCRIPIKELTIPEGVIEIQSRAFENCPIESLTLPTSLKTISFSIVDYLDNRKYFNELHISDLSAWCSVDFGYPNCNPLCIAENLYLNGQLITDLIIPEDVAEISNYTFVGGNFNSVSFNDKLTKIGDQVFSSCPNLTEVIVPNSITNMGAHVFSGCENLTSLTLPDCFTNVSDLRSQNKWCPAVENISLYDTNPSLASVDGIILSKDLSSLYLCPTAKTNLTIPESVTCIEDSACINCSNITSLKIPNSVTSIKKYAFAYCSNLKKVTIPDSLSTLEPWAFYNSPSIEKVYYLTDKPLSFGPGLFAKSIFNSDVYSTATLYVNKNAKEAVASLLPWKLFQNIQAYDEPSSSIDEIEIITEDNAPIEIFNLNGIKVGNSTGNLIPGIYILRQGSKTSKIHIP